MLKLIRIFLFVIFAINAAEACKIQIKIRSDTQNKFKIQIYIPSLKQKTERILFNGKDEKKVHIEGNNCINKKWVIRTWKLDSNENWINAKQGEAKIDGNGWLRITVSDDLLPRINDRFGILCSEGELCG